MRAKIHVLILGLLTVLCAMALSTTAYAADTITNVTAVYDAEAIQATLTWDAYENTSATRYEIRLHDSNGTQVGPVLTPSLDKTTVTFDAGYFSTYTKGTTTYTVQIDATNDSSFSYASGTSNEFTTDFTAIPDPAAVTLSADGVVTVTAPEGMPEFYVVHYAIHTAPYVIVASDNLPSTLTKDFSSKLEAGTSYYAVVSFYSSSPTSKLRDSGRVESAPVTFAGELVEVSFDSGVGSGTMDSVKVPKGSTYTLPKSTFTPQEGNRFSHWATGTKKLYAGDSMVVNTDTLLTAFYEKTPTHTVTATSLNVRQLPSTDSERIGGLRMGDTVVVLETTESGWSKISLGAPNYGYVQSKFLAPFDTKTEFTPASYVITAGSVNVREGDSLDTARLGSVTFGTVVVAIAKSGDWYQIQYGEGTGWVKGDYLARCDGTGTYTPTYFEVGDTSVNVRAYASETAERIGGLSAGKVVLATGYMDGGSDENSWIIIDYNGQLGYVKRSLVKAYDGEDEEEVEEKIPVNSGVPVSVPAKINLVSNLESIKSLFEDKSVYKLEEQDLTEIENGTISFTICPGDAYAFPDSLSEADIQIDSEEYLVSELVKNADGSITVILEEVGTYTIIAGDGGTWTTGSTGTLSFTCDGNYAKFTGVKIDGTLIDPSNYTAVSGSTIVDLKSTYLDTLSEGSHTLVMTYKGGESNSAAFTVKKASSGSGDKDTDKKDDKNTTDKNTTDKKTGSSGKNSKDGVATGDSTQLLFWILALVCSAGLIVSRIRRSYQ